MTAHNSVNRTLGYLALLSLGLEWNTVPGDIWDVLMSSIELFILCFTSRPIPYWLYCDGYLVGQRKPVHTVGQGSVQ